jgi:predicted permease
VTRRRAFTLPWTDRSARRAIDDEIERHLDERTRAGVARGLSRITARAAAEAAFGEIDRVKRELLEIDRTIARHSAMRERATLLMDNVVYAWRRIRAAPVLTATIVIVLAVGIGASTSAFTLLDRLLLSASAGVERAGNVRRVHVAEIAGQGKLVTRDKMSFVEARDLEAALHPMITAIYVPWTASLATGRASRSIGIEYVTEDFLPLVGASVRTGRLLSPEDNRFESPTDVAVISAELWAREFANDSAIVGTRLKLDGRAYTIVGVVDQAFRGIDPSPTDVWLPIATQPVVIAAPGARWWRARDVHVFRVVTRVDGDVSDATRLANARFRQRLRSAGRDTSATVQLAPVIAARGPSPLSGFELVATRLGGVAFLLLLIAVATAMNLLIAQNSSRRHELSIRRGLGMRLSHLVTLLGAEGVLYALAAGPLALALSVATAKMFGATLLPHVVEVPALHERSLAFTTFVAVSCAAAAAVVPALHLWRREELSALMPVGFVGQRSRSAVRELFLGAQTALCMVLLVVASLLLTSFTRLRSDGFGFDVRRVAALVMDLDESKRPGLDSMVARIRRMDGIENAALALPVAPVRGYHTLAAVAGGDTALAPGFHPTVVGATPEFFATLGIPTRAGRTFAHDPLRVPDVAVVGEHAAQVYWPGRSPVGECIRFLVRPDVCYRVIGVVANTTRIRLFEEPALQVYVPFEEFPEPSTRVALLIRSPNPREASRAASRILAAALGQSPSPIVYGDALAWQERPWRVGAWAFAIAAVIALLLAVVSLQAMLTHFLAVRRHELSVRHALGAPFWRMMGRLLWQSSIAAVSGVVAGALLSAVIAPSLRSLLYRTSPYEMRAYLAAVVVLFVAAAWTVMPALRRVYRVDPCAALRVS